MASSTLPSWFEPSGMEAWASGMASALGRRVRILDASGVAICDFGSGAGESLLKELKVNGVNVGGVEITPGAVSSDSDLDVQFALATLQALAETRNSLSDLVRTTARQWRELSLLYRAAELLRGGLAADAVARHLLSHATRALRCQDACVLYRNLDDEIDFEVSGDHLGPHLRGVADWGQGLDDGVVVGGPDELGRIGYRGECPARALVIVPLRCEGDSFGALVLAAAPDHLPGSEDLKLARLLAGQAGQAFANHRLMIRERENEALRRELSVAATIQGSILPEPPLDWGWLQAAAVCTPAAWVGGDAYVAVGLGDGSVLAGVTDVSGHGVSSALLTNAVISQIQALTTGSPDPAEMLRVENDLVTDRVGSMGLFVTAALLRIEPSGRLQVANAGHPPPILVNLDGRVREIEGGGLPLGILESETYDLTETTLGTGDMLVCYSDGLTEATNPNHEMFGERRLLAAIQMLAPKVADETDLLDGILKELNDFTAGRPLDDDLTVVVLRRTR